MQHQSSRVLHSRMMDILLVALILATTGAFLQIGGTSWDVTSHLLQSPESFFTPSHAVLYAGVGMLTIALLVSEAFYYCGTKNFEQNHLLLDSNC